MHCYQPVVEHSLPDWLLLVAGLAGSVELAAFVEGRLELADRSATQLATRLLMSSAVARRAPTFSLELVTE